MSTTIYLYYNTLWKKCNLLMLSFKDKVVMPVTEFIHLLVKKFNIMPSVYFCPNVLHFNKKDMAYKRPYLKKKAHY